MEIQIPKANNQVARIPENDPNEGKTRRKEIRKSKYVTGVVTLITPDTNLNAKPRTKSVRDAAR